MTSGFIVYIHEDDVIKGVICSHYIDNAWYGHLSDHDISVEFDIITQPAMRYLAFAISSDNVSWEVLHVHDTQSGSATVDVTIPDTYDGTVKLGCKVYDTPPTVGSVLNVGFDYVITGVIELALIGSRTVTLVHEDADAKMVYTIDGTDPTLESIEYAGPFALDQTSTVKARAYKEGMITSQVSVLEVEIPAVVPSVGDVVTVDGIETLVLAVMDDSGAWVSTAGAQGTECIGVDKNHDLSYYISGDDYVNQKLPIDSAKYGYEWGGIGSENSGCQSDLVGTGIVNTDNAISYDFSSETEGWPVLWEKLSEFRQSHSDKWFVPSKDELNLIYENRASLSNLSTRPNEFSVNQGVTTITIYSAYWSSTESDVNYAKTRNMGSNVADSEAPKDSHNPHVRLCVQFDSSDAEIIDDGEIDMIKKNV